jgi:hypothetical protein
MTREDEKKLPGVTMSGFTTIGRVISRIFPETIEKILVLEKTRKKCSRIKNEHYLFFLTNHGNTGRVLAAEHNVLAVEFNRQRFWWVRPIEMLPLQNDFPSHQPHEKNIHP